MMKDNLMEYKSFLASALIPVRISCLTESGWPVVVSLWFLHEDSLLYCATQKTARLVRYLRNDSRCAFEIAGDQPPYCGIRGQARARIDNSVGVDILEKLLVRYSGNLENPLARSLLANSESEVAVILEPLRINSWNFTRRMQDSFPDQPQKICPD